MYVISYRNAFFIFIKFHCTVCRELILWDCAYSNNIVRSRMENGIGLFIEQVWWIKNSTKQIGAWQIAIQSSDCNKIWLFLRIIHAKAILFLGIITFTDIGVELLLSIHSWRCFCMHYTSQSEFFVLTKNIHWQKFPVTVVCEFIKNMPKIVWLYSQL